MNFKSIFATFIVSAFLFTAKGQNIENSRLVNWKNAGVRTDIPEYSRTVNIMDHGGISDGTGNNNAAFTAALAAATPGTTIIFPAGTYKFNNTITINKDSIVLKGAGNSTKLIFDIGGQSRDCINVAGSLINTNYWLSNNAVKGKNFITLENAAAFNSGAWLRLMANDSSLIQSSWALRSVGQIAEVEKKSGDTLFLESDLRIGWEMSFSPRVRLMRPRKYVGLENFYIERVDAADGEAMNIDFQYAVDCWALGIESNLTNFSHIRLFGSSNITVRGCYLHHGISYGSGGKAYGIVLEQTSGENLVENNIFNNLRHSILFQSGSNGNVVAYNYSINPFWNSFPLPNNSAGDLVMHGNYPFSNLAEGNTVQHIVIDYSHYINGPHNTFFRNKAQGYGLFMASNAGNDQNFIGNDIPNTGSLLGAYTLTGTGHYEYGNRVRGVNNIRPAGTTDVNLTSLYLCSNPAWWNDGSSWPNIGIPYTYNSTDIPAAKRWNAGNQSLFYDAVLRKRNVEESKTWYRDADNDGFGDNANTQESCSPPSGYVSNNTDCNDNNKDINPNSIWYEDADDDGYSSGKTLKQCLQPSGYKLASALINSTIDCDDSNKFIFPGAKEICDGKDNNCNNLIDDQDPLLDSIAAATYYRDADGDGFGNKNDSKKACIQPSGYIRNNTDCNDNDNEINPNTVWYEDTDNDGFSSGATKKQCVRPLGYKLLTELFSLEEDCDDTSAEIYPGASEIANDGIDQDCDGNDLISTSVRDNVWINAQLFPNPNAGKAELHVEVIEEGEYRVRIIDISGRIIRDDWMYLSTGMKKINIEILSKGWFLAQISNAKNAFSLRIIVQ